MSHRQSERFTRSGSPRLLALLTSFGVMLVSLGLTSRAVAVDPTPDPRCGGWKDCDLPPTPLAGDPLAVLRDRVQSITTVPTLDVRRGVTLLDLGEGEPSILWEWRGDPGDASAEEWKRLKSLSEVVKLEPQTKYTFEVVTLADCENVAFDYPFKAEGTTHYGGTSYVLRILKGDEVVFDAHAQARVRVPKSTIPVAKQCDPDPRLARVTTEILHTQVLLDSDAAFQEAVSGDPLEAPPNDVVVRIEQPLRQGGVVILVYDPGARDRESVEATVFDASCPGEYLDPGRTVKLRQVRHGSPVFLGRADVDGDVGTAVKVQYEHRGEHESSLFESNEISIH